VLLFAPVGSFGSLFIEPKIVCLLFILLFSISRDGAQVVIIHKNILPNLAIFNINNSKKKKNRQMAKVQHNKNHLATTTQVTHVSLFCSLPLVMLGCDQ
jgi:hypothetical protein